MDISDIKIDKKAFSPIIMIYGPNGCGKTTLCNHIKLNSDEYNVLLFKYEENSYENHNNDDDFLKFPKT